MACRKRSAYNAAVETFREREFPMLKDSVYLDHAGSTLCSKSFLDAYAAEMSSTLYGNPHSGSSSSRLSASRVEDIRLHLLNFFRADPAEYELIFVANATAGVKLTAEALMALPQGFDLAYHEACHTSVIGARELARRSTCVDDARICTWLHGEDDTTMTTLAATASDVLFAYSAQSHVDGQRFPLSWSKDLKAKFGGAAQSLFVLLDASSLCATSQLDLTLAGSVVDFVVVSLYKIFGFPDLGALLVRRSAAPLFDQRKYFGGGTVDLVTCEGKQRHVRKTQWLHERLEDGTLPFHNILSLTKALTVHKDLFGTMDEIGAHTTFLSEKLDHGLRSLVHRNGRNVCLMHNESWADSKPLGHGPIVSFNIVNEAGRYLSLEEFEKLAILKDIHIRTGGLCSPPRVAKVLGLQSWEMERNLSAGFRCGVESDILVGKQTGVIRASLGAMSTLSDVQRFIGFIQGFFVADHTKACEIERSSILLADTDTAAPLRVKSIVVYPVKSCAGYAVPANRHWQVKAEGLAWDREWCLLHRRSGQALSQKQHPRMALLQPSFDFERGFLKVVYCNEDRAASSIEIPLLVDASDFLVSSPEVTSRVCGDKIRPMYYISEEIHEFFTQAMEVPCRLARFPPGGGEASSRRLKAGRQNHQMRQAIQRPEGSIMPMPSPPGSDIEQELPGKILLSNESPILMVSSSSIDALNEEIKRNGGEEISDSTFRANIVVESPSQGFKAPAYSEDGWKEIRIGGFDYTLLGACRRCQMISVDQSTAERRQEPLSTLAKTRRIDGKIYFGVHMRLAAHVCVDVGSQQCARIRIGQQVTVCKANSSA